MLSNINDVYRDKIYSKDFIELFDYLRNLDEDKQETLLRFILMDNYKINCFYNKYIKLDDNSIDSILMSCLDNAKVFKGLLKQASCFHGMDYFSKSLLLEDMKIKGLDSKISSISKNHILDVLTYHILDELDLYQDYYKDFMIKNRGNIYGQNLLIDYLSLRVLDLKNIDKKKYEEFLLEFIKVYYKWRKFINDHEGEYLMNDEDFIYVDKIEKLNIDDLFWNIENDYNFINLILADYLHYKTEKIEVSEDLVDEYLIDSCDEKIKTKLKIKNQNDN